MTRHNPDVQLVREDRFPPEVLLCEKFYECLRSLVDHHVGDDASLSQGSSEPEAREDVAIVALREVYDLSPVEKAGERTSTCEDSSAVGASHCGFRGAFGMSEFVEIQLKSVFLSNFAQKSYFVGLDKAKIIGGSSSE